MKKGLMTTILALVVVLVTSCVEAPSLVSAPAEQGVNFRLWLSDEVNAIDDFSELWVTITQIGVHQAGEPGEWIEHELDPPERVDLTELKGANATEIWSGELEDGRYTKVFIYVSTVEGVLASEEANVKLPSGKLQISKPFEVTSGEVTEFVYDITVIEAGQSGKYILQPQIGQSGPDQPFDDVTSQGKPEDKGKPEETGKPEGKGKPEETGKPEGKGKPEETGKPDNKGKPEEEPLVEEEEEEHPEDVEMTITSTAFQDGATIPARYTCDGEDISPALSWSGAPEGTQSFVIILDDPDAPGGTFNHWVIFNIPADASGLEEAVATTPQLENGARQGTNSFGEIGYGGPCPPPGTEHHYHFILYAIDQTLDLSTGATKTQVLDAIEGHIVAKTEIVGLYQNPS